MADMKDKLELDLPRDKKLIQTEDDNEGYTVKKKID
jgi:hypothetical protein